jgi:tRNA threonylcarbamoyladenosine biosynthesis protein TsaE
MKLLLKSTFVTHSEEETLRLAEKMGRGLERGAVVALVGEIGSGKTIFIKGLCRGLGVRDRDQVKSPTFVLLHLYEGRFPIYHFDLYRLEQESDLEAIGFDEFVNAPQAVSVVEWADRALRHLPSHAIRVQIKITGPHSRKVFMTQ